MVQSASNSNTQWPSGWREPSNASVAEAILASIPEAASGPLCVVRECITLVPVPVRLASSRRKCGLSGLPHGEDEIGGAVPRAHRSLDRRRQPRISPVAREKQIFVSRDRTRPQRVLLRRGLERGAALAHDLPGRQFALYARRLADIQPDCLSQF